MNFSIHLGSIVGSVLWSLGSQKSPRTMAIRYGATGEDIRTYTHTVFCTHGQKYLSQSWGGGPVGDGYWTYLQRLLQGYKSWEQGGVSPTKKRIVGWGWRKAGKSQDSIPYQRRGRQEKANDAGTEIPAKKQTLGLPDTWLNAPEGLPPAHTFSHLLNHKGRRMRMTNLLAEGVLSWLAGKG